MRYAPSAGPTDSVYVRTSGFASPGSVTRSGKCWPAACGTMPAPSAGSSQNERIASLSSAILLTRYGRHAFASAAAFMRSAACFQSPVISELGDAPSRRDAQRSGNASSRSTIRRGVKRHSRSAP